MKSRRDKPGRTGRSWADVLVEYVLEPVLKMLKSIKLGRTAPYKSLLISLSFISFSLGLWLMIIPSLSLVHSFLRSFNNEVLEINFTKYMFCSPQWHFLLGVIIFALFLWYRETGKAVSDEPEKERSYKERTSLQKQLLLPFDEDAEIIKGTEEKNEEVDENETKKA